MVTSIILGLLLCFATPVCAAEDALTNMPAPAAPGSAPTPGSVQTPGAFGPGAVILLPDGRQTIIEEILPDGQWRTQLGVMTPPEGVVLVNPAQPARTPGQLLPTGEAPAPVVQEKPQEPQKPAPLVKPQVAEPAAKAPEQPTVVVTPQAPVRAPEEAPHYYTMAELLPKTEVPAAPEKKEIQPKKDVKPEHKPEAPKQEKKPEKKVEKPRAEAPKAEKPKVEKPKAEKPKAEKPKVGQELHIPEHAAKTGSLDFLEGCWQGTRPEYFSKRIIKECFCFGPGGKGGRRKVLDFSEHRTCLGSSSASLSGGVLKVISSGAVCNDGERWGQAEMVCRNSGPRTPCSWVFRDAHNGRQSYQIPFVRVESCGR